MDKDPPPDSNGSHPLRRLLNFLGLARTPDTTEEFEHEIQELLEEGEEQGLISSQEGLMISSIFELKETLAKEIMTPRNEMVCAPSEAAIGEIITLITENGYSRIPVYSESPDHIIGIVHAKDILNYAVAADPPEAGKVCNPAYFSLETEKIVNLLKIFQAKKIHMAIVTDEFGVTRGLVTLEDILEEIVGEITDEHDKQETHWKVIDDNSIVTDAKVDIEEVEDFFKLSFPEGPYESIGGLIIHQLGRLPKTGDRLEFNSLLFHVVLATKRKIITVKIQRLTDDDENS